jgi:hypothetical protein
MRLDEVGSIVRKVIQEATERVTTEFTTKQTVAKDQPDITVTADQTGPTAGTQRQPTYLTPPSFFAPPQLFTPIHYPPDPGGSAPSPLKIDLTADPAGQTTYEVRSGDTLTSIAQDHDLTLDDVRLTNPKYADGKLMPGDKLLLLYDKDHPDVAAERLDIARKIAVTNDPAELATLVQQDLQLATRYAAIPGDNVKGLKTDLLALKPGDQAFENIVNIEVDKALTDWDAQGRTHEVWDPLIQAAEAGDWGKFEEVLLQQFGTAAATNPTTQAVADHKKMLLTFGPQDPAFRTAVEGGANEFLVGRPQRAANEVAQAYEQGGATAGAEKLRELTDPSKVDPLTAALIFKESKPTIDKIVGYLGEAGQNSERGYSSELLVEPLFVFRDLSAAADSASRSSEGMPEVSRVAGQLNSNDFTTMLTSRDDIGHILQRNGVGEGYGVTLLLEMATQSKASGDMDTASDLTGIVREGINTLKDNVRNRVGDLGEAALPLIEPMANWGTAVGEDKFKQWLDAHPELLAKIDEELAKVDIAGYQLNRAIDAVNQYAPKLDGVEDHGDLVKLGTMPTIEGDPQLAYAMTAGPASMFESVRQGNTELLQQGDLDNPYLIVPDPSWPTRMLRNHVQSYYSAANKPSGVGLSLFGTGTYVWGVGAHGTELFRKIRTEGVVPAIFKEDGWRNLGFLGMYGAGIAIEGRQAWALRSGQKVWDDAFKTHIKLFGWWNVLGTANYALQGDVPRTIALGAAAGGTLLSSYAGVLRWAKIGGTFATLIGSAGIFVLDTIDKAKLAARTEPYNKEFLIMAGVKPEIANILADNDGDGISPAGRLAALAEYRGVAPEEMLDYINGLDPRDARLLVDAANKIDPNDDGMFPTGGPDDRNFTQIPMWDPMIGSPDKQFLNPSVISPSTIAGLNWWATRFMPGMPMATPSGSPPDGPAYQYWAETPGAKAWQANQDLQEMAERMHLPTTPVG